MKNFIALFLIFIACPIWAQVYVETDVLSPVLKLTDRVKEEKYDLRLGYVLSDWDFSLRYMTEQGINHSGGYSGTGNVSISEAKDTYLGARIGHKISSFTLGAGAGSYNRDFETSFSATDNKVYGKNVLGLELFANYAYMMKSFFIKTEVNYLTANVPTSAKRTQGASSYDISYKRPGLNMLLLLGYGF